MANEEPTVLIIGAGTFGTSTAYHLAKQYKDPSRVTIIDRWDHNAPLEEKQAAAIDTNRIIRTDYESHLYCDLANEAIHFWFWSIAVQGHFHKTGWIVLDDKEGGFGDAVKKTFIERGGDYTRSVPPEQLQEYAVTRGIQTKNLGQGYFNPEAGWCDAERATQSFIKVALELGVQRVTGQVQQLLLNTNKSSLAGVKLHDGRILHADKIETQQHIDSRLPVVVVGGQVDIIPPSQPNRTLKINDLKTEVVNSVVTPSGHRITVPAERHQADIPAMLKRESSRVMQDAMPQWTSGRTPTRWRMCYDTVTPTEDWLLCKHPNEKFGNLYLAVGGSFHSYKFLPVAGAYMCNVLQGKSNGEEKDEAWKWKSAAELQRRQGKEFGDSPRKRVRSELSEYEDGVGAKL
ncbi:hypothetical protein HRS9139_04521 [Pyrenophora teres f. teres]|nr:hypothetical protein HRS9139_04521 [Pyrenophora teres f. teres]